MLALLVFLSFLPRQDARLFNVSIDDTHGDALTGLKPQYSPPSQWSSVAGAPPADGWYDPSQLYNGTCTLNWIGAGNVSLTFTGTRIYVFFAISAAAEPDLTFYLDADPAPAGQYAAPDGSGVFRLRYNVLAFQSIQLAHGRHTLSMQLADAQDAFFDYALYTSGEADPTPTVQELPSPTTAAAAPIRSHHRPLDLRAVAGACAGILAAALAPCAWYWARRRARRARPSQSHTHRSALQCEPGLVGVRSREAERTAASEEEHGSITPFVGQTNRAVPQAEAKDIKTRWGAAPSEEAVATPPLAMASAEDVDGSIRAQLASVCAENERARIAYEREIEMLRQAIDPPPYSDGGESRRRGSRTR